MSEGRKSTILAVAGLMLALFLVALDQTVVGTAMPQIIADLEGFEKYAWVTTAYLLASTAMIPVIGKLGDVYGRKWFIVGGVVVFLVTTALAIAAALLMKNIKLEENKPETLEEATPPEPALAATLATALESDARDDEDLRLAKFLRDVDLSPADRRKPEETTALIGIADRIETGNGDYPALNHAAAGLANGDEGDERERAIHAFKTVVRSLAERETPERIG